MEQYVFVYSVAKGGTAGPPGCSLLKSNKRSLYHLLICDVRTRWVVLRRLRFIIQKLGSDSFIKWVIVGGGPAWSGSLSLCVVYLTDNPGEIELFPHNPGSTGASQLLLGEDGSSSLLPTHRVFKETPPPPPEIKRARWISPCLDHVTFAEDARPCSSGVAPSAASIKSLQMNPP